MFYAIDNGKILEADAAEPVLTGKQQYFGFFPYEESEPMLEKFGLSGKPIADSALSKSMVFESYEGFDFLCLNILNKKVLNAYADRVAIYVKSDVLLFFCKNVPLTASALHDIIDGENASTGFDRLLCTFLERTSSTESDRLEKIEEEISALENALITSKKSNCVKEIISLRKRLMAIKRHYEQLLNVLEELQENENNLLSSNALRLLKIYSGRVERFYHSAMNLRDYVTQVREAYQAEVDISLNNTMKIFTVLTAIFLPLTLIVGWYGMNLKMPETQWRYGYPMVILLSVAVAVLSLYLFKKKKWF